MRVLLIEQDKKESIIEINICHNSSLMAVVGCFKIAHGELLPVFIKRKGKSATESLSRYVFRKYGQK